MKLNRCTAELQAQNSRSGWGFPSESDAWRDPMVQALQKFQSTSMTSSSPLALGGFLSSRVWNFPQVTSHADLNNPGKGS